MKNISIRLAFQAMKLFVFICVLQTPAMNIAFAAPEMGEKTNQKYEVTVSGKVTDENNEGLPGASIVQKGTGNGTTTDLEGNYRLDVPDGATLTISFVGYKTQEILVGSQSVIDIQLSVDALQLEDIVVVGYGTQKKEDLTGSVISVNAESLEKQGPKVNVLQALQGAVPGLNIAQTGSNAGQSSFNITIRGNNSIKASNTPLIILDGVPFAGNFNQIQQNDIKSIEVLKDASAAAIYGARGANGVILITTKTGSGPAKISYDGSYGIQQISNLPQTLNGEEFWQFAVDRVGEDIVSGFPTLLANHQAGKSTDWLDLATRNGKQQKHSLSVSGGSDDISYLISGTYTDIKGIAKGDDFKQYVARVNLAVNVTDWLEIGTNSQYALMDNSGRGPNFAVAFLANPLTNPFDDDGKINILPWPEQPIFSNTLDGLNVQDEDVAHRLFSNNYLKIDFPFLEGLSYKLNTGLSNLRINVNRFWGANTLTGANNGGQAFVSNRTDNDWLLENIISYQKQIGEHSFNFTGLISSQKVTSDNQALTSSRFPTEVLTWYQHELGEVIEPSSSFTERKYYSQMARLNYNYDSRYLLTFTVRRDGYSGFGADNKYGVFPSIALGWNITNESFLADHAVIDNLKLRLSYGRNGNQAIDPYETQANVRTTNYLGGSDGVTTVAGFYPNGLATPGLGWETSNSLNVGVDFSVLTNKISGAIDYYNTNTFDLLLNRSISSVHGITSIVQNIGETKNTGIELFLRSSNIQSADFSWETTFSFASNKNEIVDLYGNQEDDVANKWFIGKSIDTNFGYAYDGVWQLGEDNSVQPTSTPGEIKVKDANGDGEINADDRTFLGQRNPKYTAGLINNLGYKNFTLSFSFFTQQGVTKLNPLWDTELPFVDARRNVLKQNYWTENNPTNEYPANRNGSNPFSVGFFQDADFLRLRDVTIAYNFDDSFLSKTGLSRLRIYGNIKNALTMTDWQGLDPELSSQNAAPMDRTFIIGLNLGF